MKADPTSELPADIELSHSACAIADDDYEDAEAATQSALLARLGEQEPSTQQHAPGVSADYPVGSEVLVRLEGTDTRLRVRPVDAVDIEIIGTSDEVQHELQAFHRWLTLVLSSAKDGQTQTHVDVSRLRAHLGSPQGSIATAASPRRFLWTSA